MNLEAIANAISERRHELRLNLVDIVRRSGLSAATVSKLANGAEGTKPRPKTLAAVSIALDLPDSYLEDVGAGEQPTHHSTDPFVEAMSQLDRIEQRIAEVDRITLRLARTARLLDRRL
jgi:transcriptional regulator with XRE-family HTH domain